MMVLSVTRACEPFDDSAPLEKPRVRAHAATTHLELIGDLVRQHVVLDQYSVTKTLVEAEIINYADKRVLHDEIVDLDKRLDYILERYAKRAEDRKRIYLLWEKTKHLENKIFSPCCKAHGAGRYL